MKGIAIFLCDLTGIMAAPWVEAGYDVYWLTRSIPQVLRAMAR